MAYYAGQVNIQDILGADNPRYFLALRRDDTGLLYFTRIDQLAGNDSISINVPGLSEDNYNGFEYGVDYFEGRSAADHSRPHPNLYFDQYRFDSRYFSYYIDSNGSLIARINTNYVYPAGSQIS